MQLLQTAWASHQGLHNQGADDMWQLLGTSECVIKHGLISEWRLPWQVMATINFDLFLCRVTAEISAPMAREPTRVQYVKVPAKKLTVTATIASSMGTASRVAQS